MQNMKDFPYIVLIVAHIVGLRLVVILDMYSVSVCSFYVCM